jgi:ABC-type transport system involved in cytochrome bd biosynthesis fused ATPase/permease subunit
MTTAQALLAVGTLLSAVGGPAVGLYVAFNKRGLDQATADNITNQVDLRLENRHRRRYERLVALEEYADQVQAYTHQVQTYSYEVNALLQKAISAGLIPCNGDLPTVPAPPKVPLPHPPRSHDDDSAASG